MTTQPLWARGPWQVSQTNLREITTGAGKVVCRVAIYAPNHKETARLIAAAPALYTALSELLDQIDSLNGVQFTRDIEEYKAKANWEDAIERAGRALRLALGNERVP